MSWRLAVRHRTGYQYGAPARASYNEVRMTPATAGGQHLLTSRLDIRPDARPLRYVDYWGTQVHAFDVHVPHTELVVTATSVVETAPPVTPPEVGWDTLSSPEVRDRYAELLAPSAYVLAEDEVDAVARTLRAAGTPAGTGRAAVHWVNETLDYIRGVTSVGTTSAEARALGQGVCQDFSHLALALLRSAGLPARYVSGYLYPGQEATLDEPVSAESHAWVEFWAGTWIPLDPSNLSEVAERHVLVARGRDYADVRPLAGIYSGPAAQSLGVNVELTRLR
ncbi:MAG TPA: transglutaminase family protein [Mycobacteriales bacterium]|jgi:transglutaminase-like putative cysteine protease|nr:transglutaminase family protein [Mycobacteriales bacterium]